MFFRGKAFNEVNPMGNDKFTMDPLTNLDLSPTNENNLDKLDDDKEINNDPYIVQDGKIFG